MISLSFKAKLASASLHNGRHVSQQHPSPSFINSDLDYSIKVKLAVHLWLHIPCS